MPSITAANAILMLSVERLFDAPVRIQEFSADDIYDADPQESAETQMGVDGHLTGGFVYTPTVQKISLMADSPSNDFFERWVAAMREEKDTYIANGTIVLKSLNRKYAMTRGFLTNAPQIPSARRLLQSRVYEIRWQLVTPAPYDRFS